MSISKKYKDIIDISDDEFALIFEIREKRKLKNKKKKFKPGITRINYSGDYTDGKEQRKMLEMIMNGRLALGKEGRKFEKLFEKKIGVSKALLTNSGSSANLIAINSLRSSELKDERGILKIGDGILSTALNFPTTINPIIQSGFVPVLVDSLIGSYTANLNQMQEMIEDKKLNIKAIFIPHLFGSVNNMDKITKIAKKHDLYLIEDCCDALGLTWNNKIVGNFGDLSTFSFYPAHHITIGEGGAIGIKNLLFNRIIRSLRDWGKSCWCEYDSSLEGKCKKRFGWQLGKLPQGYDHKYIYSNIGFNLKPTEICAAMGIPQLEKLDFILKKREENFVKLYNTFAYYKDTFILPKSLSKANNHGWFFFPVTIKQNAKFKVQRIINFLDIKKNIETRRLFAGNITKQPAYCNAKHLKDSYNTKMVKHTSLKNSDIIMNNSFIIGTSPVINKKMMEYICKSIHEFMKNV